MGGRPDNPQETQHYDIFFSYSRKNNAVAMLIKSAIQSLGYSVFYDQDILEGDNHWQATIAKSIDLCSACVFLRTDESVESEFCQREIQYASDSVSGKKEILPIAFRRDQSDLPNSDALKLLLQPLQTTFISDVPSIAGLKDELRQALEKVAGKPRGKENSLLLTDLMATAADNLTARYRDFFEKIQAHRIESDVLNDRVALYWPFILGDEQAKLCISLNRFSKRPVCYATCQKKDECKVFAEKERQEYSLEAYLDFADHGRQSPIESLLKSLFGNVEWCGNRGTKYFFRRQILEGIEVKEGNDIVAVVELLQEAIRFFDARLNEKLQKYFEFVYGIVSIFQEQQKRQDRQDKEEHQEQAASLIGEEGWSLHDERESRVKLHFVKKNSNDRPGSEQLGILCSSAIEFPAALRIKLDSFKEDGILIRILRFNKDRKTKTDRLIKLGQEIDAKKELKEKIKDILSVPDEKLEKASNLPPYIHEQLNRWINGGDADIRKPPESLRWDISQDRTGNRLTATCWFDGCPKIRFVIALQCHRDKETLEWDQTIISDFPGTTEGEAKRLSAITGFKVSQREESLDENTCRTCWSEVSKEIADIPGEMSKNICKPLQELKKTSGRWRSGFAATFLRSAGRSGSQDVWKDNKIINATDKNWVYYLSPGMRFCRQWKTECPVMFCIRFDQAGLKNATIGWAADDDFDSLSDREKDLFWHYVLSQFPPEWGSFACKKNAIFLAEKNPDRDPRDRQPKVFETIQDVQSLLNVWIKKDGPNGESLMDRMFDVIDNAVRDLKVAEPGNPQK